MTPALSYTRFISVFFTILITIQTTACSSEDSIAEAATLSSNSENTSETIVNNSSDSPTIISGTNQASITEDSNLNNDGLLYASGKLYISSSSDKEAFKSIVTLLKYGRFTFTNTGDWYYLADNSQIAIQSLDAGMSLTEKLTISSTDGTTYTITITINGIDEAPPAPNTPAIISGIDNGTITEDIDPDNDGMLEVDGQLNISDKDAGEASFISGVQYSNYGRFAINSVGSWYYMADNNQSIIQSMTAGMVVSDIFTIRSLDGTTHETTITINGSDEANSPATISGKDTASLTEDIDPDNDGLLETSGTLYVTDSDAGESSFKASTSNSNIGRLSITSAGNWFYVANNDQTIIQNLDTGSTLIDRLTIQSIDGTSHTITISIYGNDEANSPAIISGISSRSVAEDNDPDGDGQLTVSGQLSVTDSDSGEASFNAGFSTTTYGRFAITTDGSWYYFADNQQAAIQNLGDGETLTETTTISSIDGTSHSISATIIGRDEIAVSNDIALSWTAPAARENSSAISLSEIAGYKVFYGQVPGIYDNSVTINDNTATGYTFNNLPSATYYFVVTTLDTDGRESQYSTETSVTN